LNLHSNIHITHESDVVWILYQFYKNQPFAAYPKDSVSGMRYALNACSHILDKNKSPEEI